MAKLNDPPTPRRTPAVTPSPALSVLAPFVKEPSCPKCGDGVIGVKYCLTGVNPDTGEYLLCECDRCGYVWRMACSAVPAPEPVKTDYTAGDATIVKP